MREGEEGEEEERKGLGRMEPGQTAMMSAVCSGLFPYQAFMTPRHPRLLRLLYPITQWVVVVVIVVLVEVVVVVVASERRRRGRERIWEGWSQDIQL